MVHELHRLWRVQRDLMLEYERNPLMRNSSSSSSPIHTNVNHSTNGSNNPMFYSTQNRPNFEFVREGSAQSSANIVAAKNPAFNLRLPASEYIENENGFESGFGFKLGAGRKERNFFLSDLNEPVEGTTDGLDFLGVSREVNLHRRADEGSSSGVFFANGRRANEELFLGKEKGIKPSGAHFFSPDTNRNHHFNFASNNPLGSNVFSTYQSHQNSFKDHHTISPPQLFGQKLIYSFDPSSQAQSSNIFSSSNVTDNNYNYNYNYSNNNPVAPPSSFPILDSSPPCNNKNKGLMLGSNSNSMHPLSTFVNNVSGGAGENSGFFSNAPPHDNMVFGRNSGGQSIDFSKSSWKKEKNIIAPGLDMDLNEPVPEENQEIQETKGIIKLFGTNCGGLVSEPSRPKNEIDLNNVAIEDEPNSSNNNTNTKLLGFPFFNNSSCSNNKPALHADESNNSKGRVNESANRVILIDLNEDLPLEIDPDSSNERRHEEGKKVARFVIDLEMPASEFDYEADTDIERESELGSLPSLEAADTIVLISQLKINNPTPPSPDPGALLWFADFVLSGSDDKKDPEPSSESEDLFESMTLKLEEIKADDRFTTNEFKRFGEEESSSQAGGGGETAGFTSLLFTRGGRARKRRQRRDFQRDVLPTIASLSRVEVTEDLQMIGGLMRACGQEFESALTRRAGRNGSSSKGKRQQRSPQVYPPQEIPPISSSHQVKPEQNSPHNHSNSHERILKANLVPDQCPQPKKITLVNHTHRFTQSNPPHGSPRANGPQRIVPVANPHQQMLHQNPDVEREGLSVVGWGRTTVRRNRRPRNLPLISNNPPMPLN